MSVFREWMFRVWYRYLTNIDKNADIILMNFGYIDPTSQPELDADDELNRYPVQLYHLLGTAVDFKDKEIAEIGSGRGGGLSYIVRTFKPKTALGIDLDANAVKFCNKQYPQNDLSFAQGDAQNLSQFPDQYFDIILNNESSHRYPRMDLFLKEVNRLLRPGGYFLFSDFRNEHAMNELKQRIGASGLKVLRERDITSNVVEALKADDLRKRMLVKKLIPFVIQKVALNFAGTVGSDTYNRFATRKYKYFHYVMQK